MRIKICHFIFCPDYVYVMCIFKFRRDQFKYFSFMCPLSRLPSFKTIRTD